MTNPNCEIKSKKLGLPPANNLIPKNFDILPKNEECSKKPILLKQWDDTDLWYKKDDQFEKPKAHVNLKIYTSDCEYGQNAKARVFTTVWLNTFQEYLREFNYMAELAELGFSGNILADNIMLQWDGYNDSMPNYIKEVCTKLLGMKNQDLREIFDHVKE